MHIDSISRGIIAATPKETLQAKKCPNVCDLKTMRENDRLNMPETFLCILHTYLPHDKAGLKFQVIKKVMPEALCRKMANESKQKTLLHIKDNPYLEPLMNED